MLLAIQHTTGDSRRVRPCEFGRFGVAIAPVAGGIVPGGAVRASIASGDRPASCSRGWSILRSMFPHRLWPSNSWEGGRSGGFQPPRMSEWVAAGSHHYRHSATRDDSRNHLSRNCRGNSIPSTRIFAANSYQFLMIAHHAIGEQTRVCPRAGPIQDMMNQPAIRRSLWCSNLRQRSI